MQTYQTMYDFFVSCPKNVESLLAQEITALGAEDVRETVAGVSFRGPLETAYRTCLWSRLGNRVLLRLDRFEINDADHMYEQVKAIDWYDHLELDGRFCVDFIGTDQNIRHTGFGAQKIKDGVVDRMRDSEGARPTVSTDRPDIRIHAHLSKGKLSLSLDLSGGSLHERGYRQQVGKAALKENLAAAILVRSEWPRLAQEGAPLIDPLCGSGTLLTEAVMMAADIAPGLLRMRFGFERWPGHVPKIWRDLLEEARQRRQEGLEQFDNVVRGFDADRRVIQQAKANAERAGLKRFIQFENRDLQHFSLDGLQSEKGLVLTNPPYGERLGDQASVIYLYRNLGDVLRRDCPGWEAGIFTGSPELGRNMGIRAHNRYNLFNGTLACQLLRLKVEDPWLVKAKSEAGKDVAARSNENRAPLSAGAEMFANRLRKNLRLLGKWARKEQISCYRIYDADMPEYAVAIDLYNDQVHVQEYRAPASVDERKATERLHEVISAIPVVLDIPQQNVVLKRRERQKGDSQYRRQSEQGQMMEVNEGGCRLLVNLTDYLDTGLFLDHRPVRLRIQQEAKGKRMLNLFCYTASTSVHAAHGGAVTTTSVDMSKTYLGWARKNFELNGMGPKHRLIEADCLRWLEEASGEKNPRSKAVETGRYDLIFMDPPTFSNSAKMRGVLDIQDDHVGLIRQAMKLLAPGGVLYFSNNYRKFKIDPAVVEEYEVEDISAATIDKDFQRRPGIHCCFRIHHQR